jgi:hypothetical protein
VRDLLSHQATHLRPRSDSYTIIWRSGAFDPYSYDDVRSNAAKIYQALADGSMPCDGASSSENVQRFRSWMDAGFPR